LEIIVGLLFSLMNLKIQVSMKRCLAVFLCIFLSVTFAFSKSSQYWFTNYTTAIAAAAKENKPMLLFFHGSAWCQPCIKKQQEVFSDSSFIDFATGKLIFLNVDFLSKPPLTAEQLRHKQAVKKQFGLPDDFSQGYPQVIIINAAGKVLHQEKGYDGEGARKLMDIINNISQQMKK